MTTAPIARQCLGEPLLSQQGKTFCMTRKMNGLTRCSLVSTVTLPGKNATTVVRCVTCFPVNATVISGLQI
jgi:hypothetical protein